MQVVEIDIAIPEQRARYDRLHESCPDAFVQQSSFWADAIAPLGPDRPIFLIASTGARDIAGLPLYLFEGSSGAILTSVPQPGPLGGTFTPRGLTAEQRDGAYLALLIAAEEVARRHGCLTLSIITNPFQDDVDLYERHLQPDYVFENFTQYVPLDEPQAWSHGIRNNLNRARRAGFTIECARGEADLRAWYAVHEQRHREIGAQPLDYALMRGLFCRLSALGMAHLILVKKDGEIASGGLYVHHKRVLDVFMLSTNSRFMQDAPNVLNTAYSLDWARCADATIYNWQSAPSRESGVYGFKRQWGSIERPYYFVTKRLCSEEKLRELGPERIRQEYPWHYVAPFGLFDAPAGTTRFRKA